MSTTTICPITLIRTFKAVGTSSYSWSSTDLNMRWSIVGGNHVYEYLFVDFDMSAVPAGNSIQSATVSLTSSSDAYANGDLWAHSMNALPLGHTIWRTSTQTSASDYNTSVTAGSGFGDNSGYGTGEGVPRTFPNPYTYSVLNTVNRIRATSNMGMRLHASPQAFNSTGVFDMTDVTGGYVTIVHYNTLDPIISGTLGITTASGGYFSPANSSVFWNGYNNSGSGGSQSHSQTIGSRNGWATTEYDTGKVVNTNNFRIIGPLAAGTWRFRVRVWDSVSLRMSDYYELTNSYIADNSSPTYIASSFAYTTPVHPSTALTGTVRMSDTGSGNFVASLLLTQEGGANPLRLDVAPNVNGDVTFTWYTAQLSGTAYYGAIFGTLTLKDKVGNTTTVFSNSQLVPTLKIGEFRAKGTTGSAVISIYHPVLNTALRIGMAGGAVGCLELVPTTFSTATKFRINTPQGTKALRGG